MEKNLKENIEKENSLEREDSQNAMKLQMKIVNKFKQQKLSSRLP